MTDGGPEARSVYDLVIAHLARDDAGIHFGDEGLRLLGDRLRTADDVTARLDVLAGVWAALLFTQSEPEGKPAAATLLGVLLAAIELTPVPEDAHAAWDARLRQVTGAEHVTKVLGGPRPPGTIPAGPGARFAAQAPKQRDDER